jgi:hypothetical protein
MTPFNRQYVTNEKNERIAVQVDITTFQKIEETLENFGLMKFIQENEGSESLSIAEAKTFYNSLDKK